MPPFLIHLWAIPRDLPLVCPPPPAGQASDPAGFYDLTTVTSAYNLAALVSFVLVLLMVALIYQATRVSLGPRFVWRWWLGLSLTALLCGAATWFVLYAAPTAALAGSCETSPDAFPIRLPPAAMLDRSVAELYGDCLRSPYCHLSQPTRSDALPHRRTASSTTEAVLGLGSHPRRRHPCHLTWSQQGCRPER